MAQGDIPDVKFPLEEPYSQDLDSISQWCASITDASENHNCNPFASTSFPCSQVALVDAFNPVSCDSDWFSRSGSASDSNSDSDRDISCFVTDLFERGSSEQRDGYSDRNSGLSLNEFEIGGCSVGVDFELGERSSPRGVDSLVEGLRVVRFDSESDSEDGNFGVLGFNSLDDNEGRNNGVNDWDIRSPLNGPCQEDQRSLYEEFDWEEVEERVNERENLSIVIDDEFEEEVQTMEEYEPAEQAARNIEWEILLAINNLAMNSSLERNVDSGTESYFSVQDDYIYAVGGEYETLFEQFIESETALKGSPPAAKSVVENLPSVELTMEELQKNDVVCAVCKDKILVEEKVKRLPCCHYYHGDCIVPWLGIRNTCPVCRYELPTDDADYELRKSQRARRVSPTDSQVTFNFELFA
ncbi:hypothetical protein G4B88_000921 [Cannabis sativa]|uniref:RING-type E3 ubiquitin transferase n=1 Tax=Cannabis sativa TaxID=3483 RepID=A0A7J6E1R3_CANSA|nr:hypothetical protein G4B88_000921 [Cannabis sativa]